MDFVTTYELVNSWTFSVDHFQTSEYCGEQFSAGQTSANWDIYRVSNYCFCVIVMLNLAIDEYLYKNSAQHILMINWQEFQNSSTHSYKIHTLVPVCLVNGLAPCLINKLTTFWVFAKCKGVKPTPFLSAKTFESAPFSKSNWQFKSMPSLDAMCKAVNPPVILVSVRNWFSTYNLVTFWLPGIMYFGKIQ